LDVIQAWADQAVDYAVNTLMVQDVENEIGAIPDLHTAAT
jgi:hypothetical protein